MDLAGCISTTRMVSLAKAWLGFAAACILVDVLVSQGMTDVENQFIRDTTNRFSQLSRPDMLTAWHTECHRRCRYQLTWTINLSCQFDPYRIPYRKRRAIDKPSIKNIIRDVEATVILPRNETTDLHPTFPNINDKLCGSCRDMTYETILLPWTHRERRKLEYIVITDDLPEFMTRNSAASFLNSRRSRRHKRNAGIMEECCINKACSWEEFGEYCQRHPRSRRERDSVCVYN